MQVTVRPGRGLAPTACYALTAALVALAGWLELALAGSAASMLALTPFGLSVALSVWLGGFRAGLLAVVLSAAAIDLFLIDPGTILQFSSAHNTIVWATYTGGWLFFCVLAERVHRRADSDRLVLRSAQDAAAQSDRVAQLTASLAHARTPAAVLEASLHEPLHALRGDAGLAVLVTRDGRSAEVASAAGYGDDRDARVAAAVAPPSPVWDAIGRGAPVIAPSLIGYAADRNDRGTAAVDREVCALAAVPLLVGSAVVAVVQLEFLTPRPLTSDDREYLKALAVRGAEALDRTWQYESALRARAESEALRARADQELAEREAIERALRASEARYRTLAARTGRLHGLAAALSGAVTVDAVARAVVEQGRKVLGATNGDVLLLVDDGHFETIYSDAHPEQAGARLAAEPGLCATEAVRSREPVFIGSFAEWQERYARSAAMAADGGYASSATLPLHVDAAVAGVLEFHFTAPVNFDDEYQSLLISVAQHCAQALDRARVYEAAQHARAEAETANRLKDDFVSIVSHELRTPLTSMLGWTALLRKGTLDPAATGRALQSLHDNATRQARLVEELLDLSSITAGRTRLDVVDVDLRGLLRGVVETMIPAAAGNGLTLDLEPVPPLTIQGDERRLEQIFLNVLGNAVKFTPKGGRIAIAARPVDGTAEVRVTDSGPGIDPEFLPHMFDRFRQAGDSGRQYGGVGLGLSIAKELVEAHKGRIAAESDGFGHGATFVVTLPAAPAVSPVETSVH